MLKHMLLGLGAASLLVVVTAMPVQAASLLGTPPPSSVIVNVTGTDGISYQWVWASPCAGDQPSCGLVTVHDDYQLPVSQYDTYDFGFPTDDQWNASFSSRIALGTKFGITFNSDGTFVENFNSSFCAANYFSIDQSPEQQRCDPGDIRDGYIWNSPLALNDISGKSLGDSSTAETFLVSVNGFVPDPNGSVPEPSSLFLLGAGLLGFAAWRWKHAA
jgi:hypothetical protein